MNQSRFTNEENAMNDHVTQFSDLDDLLTANHVDVSAARLVKAIRTKDAATYIEIVSTPKGRVTLAGLDEATRALAKQLGEQIATQTDTSETSTPTPPDMTMTPLAKKYIANAVSSLTRVPSPKLKPDFRATLLHWRQLLIAALKTQDEPMALVNVVLVLTASEGAFDALRMLRNVGSQMLWQAALDVARDRRTASEVKDEQAPTLDEGQTTYEPSDTVAAPTEDDAKDAFMLGHTWLSAIADNLAVDEDDRIRLGLESGLEYTSVQDEDHETWVRVFDVDEAIEIQLEKNRQAMVKRNADTVLKRRDAFMLLAKLAA
jgi:hypothetical protein